MLSSRTLWPRPTCYEGAIWVEEEAAATDRELIWSRQPVARKSELELPAAAPIRQQRFILRIIIAIQVKPTRIFWWLLPSNLAAE